MSNELSQACEDNKITITSIHLYVDSESEHFPRDKWATTLHYKDRSVTIEFFTGSGHRVLAYGVKRENPRKYVRSFGSEVIFGDAAAIAHNYLVLKRDKGKIIGPQVADVLASMLIDASACESTFDDWCSDLGLNNDSLNSINTYLTCQRNGTKVMKFLGSKFMELRNKTH